MEINYVFRFSDYQAIISGLSRWGTRKLRLWLLTLAILANYVIALVIMLTSDSAPDYAHAWPSALFATVMLIWIFLFVPWLHKRNYRKLKLDGKEMHIAIDDSGLTTAQQGIEGKFQWSAFTRFSRSPSHALLWINKLQALVIPFDAFTSEAQRDVFLNFIASKVPAKQ